MKTLGDIFKAHEARLLEITRAEMAADKAAFDALSEEEKARQWEAFEAKWEAFEAACEASEAEEDEDDSEDDEED